MFSSKPSLRGKRSKRDLIFLIIHLHILILLLAGVLLMMFNFQKKSVPIFSILFGNPSEKSTLERKAQIFTPEDQRKEQKTSPIPPSKP